MSLPASMAVSLLCLPCAGASAGMYLRWRLLGDAPEMAHGPALSA